jgi:hypothetical protein
MTERNWSPHLAALAFGYGLSTVAALGMLGPYTSYAGQPRAEQMIVLFLLPVTATVIWALLRSLSSHHPPAYENGSADAALRTIMFWVMAFLVAVHTLLVGVLVGVTWVQPWATRGVVVLVGLTAMIIGNQLPRTRPNMAVGIRTIRTLSDRRLWLVTHRMTGYTAVALGAITIAAGLFLSRSQVAAVPFVAFMTSLAWLGGYYLKVSRVSSHSH